MTLEFFRPFLWRAPPLERQRESREFFPEQAGKGSVILSYEAEMDVVGTILLPLEWRRVCRGTS